MRVYDNGSSYTVTVSASEVDAFNAKWPGSTLKGPQSFTFDVRNGDLVDRSGKGDGQESVALSHDAQSYGKERLKVA